MARPTIVMTMGDPAGVGPEICLKAVAEPAVLDACDPVIIGDGPLLECVARHCGLPTPPVVSLEEWKRSTTKVECPAIVQVGELDAANVVPGTVDADCGQAAYRYISTAIDETLAGRVQAVVTAPVNKESLKQGGCPHPGHTEILAERTKTQTYCMMLTSREITCALVTTHVGLADVSDLLTTKRITETIRLSNEAMCRIRGRPARLLVCGLNPHAGEHGMIGRGEEERIIGPAVEAARSEGINVAGPIAPDTAFLPKYRQKTDCYICMYHDQGLIPLKSLAFDRAVNVTLGLPIVRTSVDHGTAFDIAWKGRADAGSLIEAILLARQLLDSDDWVKGEGAGINPP